MDPPGSASKSKPGKRKTYPTGPAYCVGLEYAPVPSPVVRTCRAVGLSSIFLAHAGSPSGVQLFGRRLKKDVAYRTLSLVCLSIFAVNVGQNILAPNLTAVAASFGVTDEKERDSMFGGRLSAAFYIFSMPFFLLSGYLADNWDRKQLLLIIVGANCAASLLCCLATSFSQFFVLRVLMGASVMSALPLGYSVLGDLFPAKERGSFSTWLLIAMGLGVMLGQVLSGFLGPSMGWRSTFFVAALPGIAALPLSFRHLNIPPRGAIDDQQLVGEDLEGGNASSQPVVGQATAVVGGLSTQQNLELFGKRLASIFWIRTNVLLFAQCIPGSVPWGVLFVYMNDFLAQEKGLTIEQATMIIGLFGVGSAIGGIVGGIVGQKIYNSRSRYLSVMMGGLQLLAVPLMWRIVGSSYSRSTMLPMTCLVLFTGVLASMAATNVRFMLTNVNIPSTRGLVMSIFDVFNNIGRGLGPIIVSWLINAMGSREGGFQVAMAAWWLDAAFMSATFFYVEADEKRASRRRDSDAEM